MGGGTPPLVCQDLKQLYVALEVVGLAPSLADRRAPRAPRASRIGLPLFCPAVGNTAMLLVT